MDRRKLASLKLMYQMALRAKSNGLGVLNYLRKFKNPTHNISRKGDEFLNIDIPKIQRTPANFSRGFKTSIGNTADNLAILSQGVKGKGAVEGSKQVFKNIGTLGKRQMKGDLYKEINLTDAALVRKNGKLFAKSKWAWGKDREVIGKTNRGSVLIRRRKLYDPISIAAGGSGPVIGASVYALGDKEKPKSRRLTEAAVDTALFSTSVPLGMASIVPRIIYENKKK